MSTCSAAALSPTPWVVFPPPNYAERTEQWRDDDNGTVPNSSGSRRWRGTRGQLTGHRSNTVMTGVSEEQLLLTPCHLTQYQLPSKPKPSKMLIVSDRNLPAQVQEHSISHRMTVHRSFASVPVQENLKQVLGNKRKPKKEGRWKTTGLPTAIPLLGT